jgi:predicted dehydrogenase
MDYDRFDHYQLFHRAGDAWLPKIHFQEPLRAEVNHFLECIRTDQVPLTGAKHGRDVVAILEAGHQALKTGQRVDLTT